MSDDKDNDDGHRPMVNIFNFMHSLCTMQKKKKKSRQIECNLKFIQNAIKCVVELNWIKTACESNENKNINSEGRK